jgi:hypothetical protein
MSATNLDRLYAVLAELASTALQGRPLRELPGRDALPERGVYFFMEPGELRRCDPSASRVVRVGTHALSKGSRSTLRGRLQQHLGTRQGNGNHRGSVFRLHVGAALLARDGLVLPTWGSGSSAPAALESDAAARSAEAALEQRVSLHIGAMPVLWLAVPDDPGPDSDRAYLERNAIALLSSGRAPADPASAGWLGHHSARREVRDSALWNVNHVDARCEPGFLDRLEALVAAAGRRR